LISFRRILISFRRALISFRVICISFRRASTKTHNALGCAVPPDPIARRP
jgi:hypothetical protein